MKNTWKKSRVRSITSALLLTAVWGGANYANADVVATVNPGAVGSALSESSVLSDVSVVLTDPTIDRLDVFFSETKYLEVFENKSLLFRMEEFGPALGGGNSISNISWGLLDESGAPIFTVTEDDKSIATVLDSRGTSLPGPFRVFGFFATWDPSVSVQAGVSAVGFGIYGPGDVIVGKGVPVKIDIRPATESREIPVAILSDVNEPFDPLQINIQSVRFGPGKARPIRIRVRDVNKDGLADLLLKFKIRRTGIECGDTATALTGKTYDGQFFTGIDAVSTVDCD